MTTDVRPDHPRPGRLRRAGRALSPAQLALSQYRLTPGEKTEMYARGIVLAQVAVLIGSALYFLFLQRAYGFHDPHQPWLTYWGLKDTYDRFPIHVQNGLAAILAVTAGLAVAALAGAVLAGPVLAVRTKPAVYTTLTAAVACAAGAGAGFYVATRLGGWHVHWFAGQDAPVWFITARHQFRHFLIGALAAIMVSSVTIGLGKKLRRRVPNWAIPVRFIAAFAAAMPVAAVLIFVFAWLLPHLGWDAGRLGLVVTRSNGQVLAAVTIGAAGLIAAGLACRWRKAPAGLLVAASLLTGAALYAAVVWLLPRYGISAAPFGRGTGILAGQWIGKGAWEATLTGVLTGACMKPIMRPAQDTIQLISIEKKMLEGQAPAGWWRPVYGANYVKRFRYCTEQGHQPQKHGAVMGLMMALSAPAALALIVTGIWLLWAGGPATGVH